MPQPTRVIQCADCHQDYETARANTKYCGVCRLFRDLMYLGNRTTKCLVCAEKFALVQANEQLCPKCDVVPSSKYVQGTCAFCSTDTHPLLSADVAVCTVCAHDKGQRKLFVRAVAQKRGQRTEALA